MYSSQELQTKKAKMYNYLETLSSLSDTSLSLVASDFSLPAIKQECIVTAV